VVGYNVTYSIGDQVGKVKMDREPGSTIPLDKNGKLILSEAGQ